MQDSPPSPPESKPRGGARPGAGRPPRPPTLAAALREAFPVERLVTIAEDLMRCGSEEVRFKTLLQILDRTHGKVADKLELGPAGSMAEDDAEVDGLTMEQLRALEELDAKRDAILGNRDQNPKVLDGGAPLLPVAVAHAIDVPDEE